MIILGISGERQHQQVREHLLDLEDSFKMD